ncbi:zf-TFIIB domain-containing protein [Granulosicoccus antarcticus]
MKCPRCNTPLSAGSYASARVFRCDNCAGIALKQASILPVLENPALRPGRLTNDAQSSRTGFFNRLRTGLMGPWQECKQLFTETSGCKLHGN